MLSRMINGYENGFGDDHVAKAGCACCMFLFPVILLAFTVGAGFLIWKLIELFS